MMRLALFIAVLSTHLATVAVAEEAKPKGKELQVFLGDKAVGTEVLRTSKGAESTIYGTDAQLQDKVGKNAWKSFKQRGVTEILPDGTLRSYDRWIDVAGATQQLKLFNFNGQWRIAVTEAAIEGKKPKPKVTDVKLKAPQIVLDERLPSLVALALERFPHAEGLDYVRVDDASWGHLSVKTEALVDGKGNHFSRVRLDGDKLHLTVLRDHAGHVVSIQGVDSWRAVAKDTKVPADLKPDAAAAPSPAPAALPAGATQTH